MNDKEYTALLEKMLKKGDTSLINKEDLRPKRSGVAGVIHKDDKILMLKHVKFGWWTIPVGKVDEKETPEKALKRELFEEVGITPIKYELVVTKKVNYTVLGKPIEVTHHIYDISKYSGTPRNKEPKKHKEIKWMSIDEIKDKGISDATKFYLEYVEKKHE